MAETFPPEESLRPPLPPRRSPYAPGVWVTGWNRAHTLFGFPTQHRGHLFILTGKAHPSEHQNAGYFQPVSCMFCHDNFPRTDGEWLQVMPTEEQVIEFRDLVAFTVKRLTRLDKILIKEITKT